MMHPIPATILVVDDMDLVRHTLTRTLTLAGYNVLEAADGREALDIIRKNRGLIDLTLSDILMPLMNGTELAGQVQKEFPGSRMILMSAYLPEGLAVMEAEGREILLLQKPIGQPELLRAIASALGDRAQLAV
jgi:two-component system, cell cycle sensor histidine kinase and response regulator CckA